jgi:hypothetical protein
MKILQEALRLKKEAQAVRRIRAVITLSGLSRFGVQGAVRRRSAGMRVIRLSGITAARNAAIILSLLRKEPEFELLL